MNASRLCLLIAVILFVLGGFQVHPAALGNIDIVDFGLAFFASSFLV